MMRLDKLAPEDYPNMLAYVDKTTCGAVYPLSIAELTQRGDIYASGDSALFWHYSGFAFPYGACDDTFLNRVHENFLSADSVTPRRFILFATNERVKRFFRSKETVVAGTRYFFEYPDGVSSGGATLSANFQIREINAELFHKFEIREIDGELSEKFQIRGINRELFENFQIREIDEELFDKTEGAVTPRFSWANAPEFLDKGKGYCVTDGQTAAAWAFSAAVSAEEIDIGVETQAEYRRLGLGTAVAERMIQDCLAQRKRPVWACNASNTMSRRLRKN